MTTILFELGTEELPPKNLKTLRDALLQNVKNFFTQWELKGLCLRGSLLLTK